MSPGPAAGGRRAPDVAFWLRLNPDKGGTLEDFLCRLSARCREIGLSLAVVMGPQIAPEVARSFREWGVRYLPYDPRRVASPAYRWRLLRRLAPRLVHYRFLGLCPPEVPALRLAGIRVLVADHSSGPARPLRDPLPWRALKPARRRLYARWVNGYLAVSAYVARRLESQNLVPRAKITVVRNGVDLERFRPLDPAGRLALRRELVAAGPEAEVVAFAGQVNRDKGVDLLLGAAEGLLARRPRAVLALAGQGEMSPEVARTARARGDGRLVALGQMQGVERLFQAADVAVLPSVWEEAFAHTLVEAQACGLPVVASRIGGNPEAVEEGVTGLLVPPADAASLQAALELLLADGGRRRDMAAAARRRAESRFTIARSVEETAGLYARLLAP